MWHFQIASVSSGKKINMAYIVEHVEHAVLVQASLEQNHGHTETFVSNEEHSKAIQDFITLALKGPV